MTNDSIIRSSNDFTEALSLLSDICGLLYSGLFYYHLCLTEQFFAPKFKGHSTKCPNCIQFQLAFTVGGVGKKNFFLSRNIDKSQ